MARVRGLIVDPLVVWCVPDVRAVRARAAGSCCPCGTLGLRDLIPGAIVAVVEGYAKSVALASDTLSRVWVDMITSRVVGVNP